MPSWSVRSAAQPQSAIPSKRPKNPLNNCSIKQIEDWLSETLGKSQPPAAQSLFRFQIDRISLQKACLSPCQIDRLYRTLYVSSDGLFATLNSLLTH